MLLGTSYNDLRGWACSSMISLLLGECLRITYIDLMVDHRLQQEDSYSFELVFVSSINIERAEPDGPVGLADKGVHTTTQAVRTCVSTTSDAPSSAMRSWMRPAKADSTSSGCCARTCANREETLNPRREWSAYDKLMFSWISKPSLSMYYGRGLP